MKLRVGTSILLLLQARAPATAFSSPLSSSSSSSSTTFFHASARSSSISSSRHRIRGSSLYFHRGHNDGHLGGGRGGGGGGGGGSSIAVVNSSSFSSLAFISRGGAGSTGTGAGAGSGAAFSNTAQKATISKEDTEAVNSDNGNKDSSNVSSSRSIMDDQKVKDEITKAALNSIDITGPSTYLDNFAQIPFVNTSKLNVNTNQQQGQQQQHRVLFILGGPGAGKGTQSQNIVNEYKCIHLSVGELLRKERTRGDDSPHAELIESCLVAGKIVPVEISLGLVRNAMDEAVQNNNDHDNGKNNDDENSNKNGPNYGQPIFLVDGFPRNYDNLSGWTQNMPNYATCIGSLVYDCPMDVLEKRILGRAETSGRSDDNLESARKRFTTFQEQTMPVVHALEEVELMQKERRQQQMNQGQEQEGQGKDGEGGIIGKLHIHHIAADGTVDQVWDATKEAMDGYVQNDVLSANALLLHAININDLETYASLTSEDMLELSEEDDIDNISDDTKSTVVSSAAADDDDEIQQAFKKYETFDAYSDSKNAVKDEISNAQVDVRTGTKAVVSYDRRITSASGESILQFRESRVWSHESKGWVCVHFVRKPLDD